MYEVRRDATTSDFLEAMKASMTISLYHLILPKRCAPVAHTRNHCPKLGLFGATFRPLLGLLGKRCDFRGEWGGVGCVIYLCPGTVGVALAHMHPQLIWAPPRCQCLSERAGLHVLLHCPRVRSGRALSECTLARVSGGEELPEGRG